MDGFARGGDGDGEVFLGAGTHQHLISPVGHAGV